MSNTADRQVIIDEYLDGTPVGVVARQNGLSERRVYQIIKEAGVKRTRPNRGVNIQPISEKHRKIGARVRDHYYDLKLDRASASTRIGITSRQLLAIEQGVAKLELLTVIDLATFLGTTVGELVDG